VYEDQFNPEEDIDIFDFDSKKKDKINDADLVGGSLAHLKGSSDNILSGTANDTNGIMDSESKLMKSNMRDSNIKYDSSSIILDSKNKEDNQLDGIENMFGNRNVVIAEEM